MANFKTHATLGLGLATIFTFLCFFVFFAINQNTASLVFLVFFLGSLAPDMDSDSSIPFHIVFGTLALFFGFLLGMFLFSFGEVSLIKTLLWGFGGGVLFWVVVGGMFKKLTKHRGMVHSFPVALLFGFACFWVADFFLLKNSESTLIGIAGTLGYILHLFLDEVYSMVDFEGRRIGFKRSLGTAMKFFSRKKRLNAIVYGALFWFLFLYGKKLLEGMNQLFY